MNEEDIDFLISIQDLEHPEFDNACLERENKRLQQENKQLKDRIDEAIEYIKENKASLPMGRDEFTCEMRYSDDVVLAHKLLEILGDEK